RTLGGNEPGGAPVADSREVGGGVPHAVLGRVLHRRPRVHILVTKVLGEQREDGSVHVVGGVAILVVGGAGHVTAAEGDELGRILVRLQLAEVGVGVVQVEQGVHAALHQQGGH